MLGPITKGGAFVCFLIQNPVSREFSLSSSYRISLRERAAHNIWEMPDTRILYSNRTMKNYYILYIGMKKII